MRHSQIALFLLGAAMVAACGRNAPEDQAAAHAGAQCPEPGIAVTQAWARPTRAGRQTSAAYLTLCNGGDEADALTGVSFSAAAAVELHETVVDNDGIASMSPIDEVALPAGEAANLAPGGAHIMLIGLTDTLEPGENVELLLEFKNAPPMTVAFNVRDAGSGQHH